MKQLAATLLLVISVFTVAIAQRTCVYTGKLGNAEIEMHLRTIKNDLYGYYFIKGTKKLLPLNGERKEDKLKINEYEDRDGFIYFDAVLKGKTLSGIRIDSVDNNRQTFTLTETRTDTTDKRNDLLTGYYRHTDEDGSIKDLSLCCLGNDYIYFELGVFVPGCTGNINGIMPAAGPVSSYSSKDCNNLGFTLHGDAVKVKEQHCTPHGKTCNFEGSYLRQ